MANQAAMIWRSSHYDYVCGLTSARAPADDEWEVYLRCLREAGARPDRVRGFAITLGGGPTPKQRAQLEEFPWLKDGRAVVITDSALARGMITAIMWLTNARMKAFAPRQMNSALEFIEMPPEERPRFLQEVHALGAQMGGPNPADLLR